MSESATNHGPDPAVISRMASQRGHYKQQARATAKELGEAREQLKTLSGELETLKKGDQSGRVKELESELRTLRHRRAFDRLAKERGASDDVLDDLFEVLKYRADKDDPDELAIGKLLDEAKEHKGRSRFFAAPSADDDDDQADDDEPGSRFGDRGRERKAEPPARKPGTDPGRGGRSRPEDGPSLTRDQLSDPKFMLDPRNAERIRNARIRG